MKNEKQFLEQKELRDKFVARIEVLDKVKGLQYKVRKAHSFRCGMDSMILNF